MEDTDKANINDIFQAEEKMFFALYDFLSEKYKSFISKKIKEEKEIFGSISKVEKKVDKKPEIKKSEIDENYFDKRSLNINNL